METILTTLLEDAWDEVQNMCDTWVYEELGAEFDRLAAELDQVKYDRSVKHDRDKYIGMWRSQCQITEQVMKERDRLTVELARYKQGVEVEDFVNRYGVLEAEFELRPDLWGKRVRVLIMKVEE